MHSVPEKQTAANMITFYHDIEQDFDTKVRPEECRRVVREFLSIEKKYEIPATYNIVGRLFQQQPELIELITQNDQEVAFHSYNHPSPPKPESYSREIELCRKTSSLPRGYRSPRSMWNQSTIESLWRNDFLWNAENDLRGEPYFIHAGLVRLPIANDDWPLQTGEVTVDEWVQQFSDLARSRRYFAIGMHDCYTSLSPDERLQAWERVVRLAIEHKALLVTFSQAADLYRRAMLTRFYAKNAHGQNGSLYPKRRLQEMVKGVAEKIDRPVIADLGSGGALSCSLGGITKKIFCVDPSGRIPEALSSEMVQPILGEVTDSGLPSDSVDLIICYRIMEYLFDPNDLADEIKRIGKIGATYFVVFATQRKYLAVNQSPSKTRSVTPDKRIIHYFSQDEIEKWADQVGPGSLIGIKLESGNSETEQRYGSIESEQPFDELPTHRVFIGTIREKSLRKRRKTVPLSAFEFRSKQSVKEYVMAAGLRFPMPIRKLGRRVLRV